MAAYYRETSGLTACTPGSASGPALGNEYGKTLLFYLLTYLLIGFTLLIAYQAVYESADVPSSAGRR